MLLQCYELFWIHNIDAICIFRLVGQHAANFVKFLVSHGSSYDNFHVLGASLGAHAAASMGYHLEGKLGRMTGLDPSGPIFHSAPSSDRLDKTDAQFVDVIHTGQVSIDLERRSEYLS